MVKVSDFIIDFVAQKGVSHIFMLPGGGCMHLVDSVGRTPGLAFVGNLHEQAAVIGADGYAQYKNDLGVALVTTGPGGTNAITGVAAAWIDSTPLMIISGQVKRKDLLSGKGVRQMGIQEVDIISMVSSITKYAVTVTETEDIRYHLEKAYALATRGRPGPVWIDIPLDIQGAVVDETRLRGYEPDDLNKDVNPDLNELTNKAIELLNNSERPIVLVGMGVRLAKAEKELFEILRVINIPVLATWRIMDLFPEDAPYYFGRPGSIASRAANFVQQNADFILTIGARLDLPQVGHSYPNFARSAKKVIVDIDNAEISKIDTKIDIRINADAKEFLRVFVGKLCAVKTKDQSAWLLRCEDWKKQYPIILPDYLKSADLVNTYALIDVLSDLLTEHDNIVPGSSGSCAEITRQAFRMKKGQRMINSPGLGSMGFGLPQSIGVCLASGGRRTVCIVGDGGLQHNIQELETLKRLNIPVKVFVLNNNGYASIRNTHNRFFERRLVCCDPSSGLTLPDTCRVASAYGLKTKRILNQHSLREDVLLIIEEDGPVICDVMVDPDIQTAPKLSSMAQPDGTMVSGLLEDMWPFLDREEFKNNMIILEGYR